MLKPIHKSEFNAPPKFSFNRLLGGVLDRFRDVFLCGFGEAS